MSQLVCPMCSGIFQEEGNHFYKHFKYKRYACGENSCDLEFYTEAERNTHCTTHKHKRSFQKTVNPYMEKLVAMVTEDARELSTKDMDAIIEERWGKGSRQEKVSGKIRKEQEKKKRTSSEESTSTPIPKKVSSKTSGASATSGTTGATGKSPATPSIASKRANLTEKTPNSSIRRSPPTPPTSSAQPTASSSSAIVDSTTNDNTFAEPVVKKARKKRESETAKKSSANAPYEEMSALEKIVGFFDPDVPERRDAARVTCEVCKKEIVYDFIIRRGHVSQFHINADVSEKDYDDVLTAAMNKSFPDLPNTSLACQLCMIQSDVKKPARREHIEKQHGNALPVLKCPCEIHHLRKVCGTAFKRQCALSAHMKQMHRIQMCSYKSPEFQQNRRRRNVMIEELMRKCFPWAPLESIENSMAGKDTEKQTNTNQQAAATSFNLENDVRFRESNKTRRAPQYNNRESSESSSDSEDTSAIDTTLDPPGDPKDFSEDVIFIKAHFNVEIAQKLSERIGQIKQEVMDEDDDVPEVIIEKEKSVKREESSESPSNSSKGQRSPIPASSILAPYEPIVPPPGGSPDPFNCRREMTRDHRTPLTLTTPSRILDPITPRTEGNESRERPTSRQSSHTRITFDDNTSDGGSWSRNSTWNNRHPSSTTSSTSSSYNRPYHNNYRGRYNSGTSRFDNSSSNYSSNRYDSNNYNNDSYRSNYNSSTSSNPSIFSSSRDSGPSTSGSYRRGDNSRNNSRY